MRTISIINLKGGVCKTTTSVNMAYALSELGDKRVLLIDNDKQGNASKTFNLYDPEDENTIARAMLEKDLDVREIIKKTKYEKIDMVTANMDLLSANFRTTAQIAGRQQTKFRKAFAPIRDEYDYCIIDNAPDINMNIVNALVMSEEVIVPIVLDQYALDGLEILIEQIEQVQDEYNEALDFSGCLITQYQKNELNLQGIELLKKRGIPVFEQYIRRTEKKVHESTFAKMPVMEYSVRCGASQDYRKFVLQYLEESE